jgi:hypothetical protein
MHGANAETQRPLRQASHDPARGSACGELISCRLRDRRDLSSIGDDFGESKHGPKTRLEE